MDWKEKLNAYREFYDEIKPKITSGGRWGMERTVRKFIQQNGGLSPIEEIFWDLVYVNGLVFYPQYPIANYVTDFCNPIKKIVVECDGEKFHNIEKDRIRDSALNREGYKVFRLSGKKITRDADDLRQEISTIDDFGDSGPELMFLYQEYYCDTADGFIESMKDILFDKDMYKKHIHNFDLKLLSLSRNRIIQFSILPPL